MENIEGSGVETQNLWNRAESFCQRLFGLIKGISDEDKEKIISGLKVLLQDGDDNLLEKGLTKAAVDGKKYGTVVIPNDKIKNLLDPSLIEKLSALKGKKFLLESEEHPEKGYNSNIYIKIVNIDKSGNLTIKIQDYFENLVYSNTERILNAFIISFDTNLPPSSNSSKEVRYDERRGCIKEIKKYVLSEVRDTIKTLTNRNEEDTTNYGKLIEFINFITKNQKVVEGGYSNMVNENKMISLIFDKSLMDFVLTIEEYYPNIKHL